MLHEFLTSSVFYNFGVPLITTFVIVFVKMVSRSDSSLKKFKKEDLAVGLDLSATAIIIYCVESAKELSKSTETPEVIFMNNWLIIFLCLGTWVMSTVVRLWGWRMNSVSNNLEITWWAGIIIPDIYGLVILTAIVKAIGG